MYSGIKRKIDEEEYNHVEKNQYCDRHIPPHFNLRNVLKLHCKLYIYKSVHAYIVIIAGFVYFACRHTIYSSSTIRMTL